MQLISKFNKGFRFSSCVIDIYSKYTLVIPWVIPKFDDTKFLNGDTVKTSKYKNIFAKCYTPNWSEEVFVIKKVKNTVP